MQAAVGYSVIFSNQFTANLPSKKDFLKSVKIWQNYGHKFVVSRRLFSGDFADLQDIHTVTST